MRRISFFGGWEGTVFSWGGGRVNYCRYARIIIPLRQEAQEFFEFVAKVELLQNSLARLVG